MYHPKKPGKLQVVFDCTAEFQGHSLNCNLLQGPALMNSLVGVLCRFRQEPVAFACNIEGMFHQVHINEEHRDFLCFLWWGQGDTTKEPEEYRMTVHLFGATSSPGCTNSALQLKLKTKVVLPPPGVFKSADLYARKWWRQVQHLTNEFCCRWKKEFPLSLQERQKWTRTRKNLQVNDVVIIKDDDTR